MGWGRKRRPKVELPESVAMLIAEGVDFHDPTFPARLLELCGGDADAAIQDLEAATAVLQSLPRPGQ